MKSPAFLPLAATLAGIVLAGFSAIAHPQPHLVWNASASAPIGLYRVVSGAPERGDFVLVRLPKAIEKLAAIRGYLPAGVPLIKRIAAVAGDDVCAVNRAIIVNGEIVARQRKADRAGRSLPRWNECRALVQGEFFLLGDAPDSFDSRYFGPMTGARVIGRLAPLWID
ncbi:conjugative transfer signal peptidase TraF [Tistlia consotensis]|uniref:Conjugative transfer signal peptidase TraF n=1 Tax=Tistlia consotensis USBA 355 TaxID=560819 RepID=A0A1Y6CVX8_9PROT|nr:conjugative transfer signal peptidase TraF [Tistlia consotensis]SMF81657.1 conjugative transfer signal peptidase TraF [Tistlia consotensis USBA 355]SNS24116.1 conjugative transfer signal peptidase TraF [Tistlia consotensis]